MPSSNLRNWALAAHLSLLLNFVFGYGGIVAALVLYFAKKGEDPFLDGHLKEALNFEITIMLVGLALLVLFFMFAGMLGLVFGGDLFVGGFLVSAGGLAISAVLVNLVALVWGIQAASAASNGKSFRYPFSLRLIR